MVDLADLDRANRVLAMSSRINRAIVHAQSPDSLYREACEVAVDCGLFRAAWIGLADAYTGQLRMLGSAGGIEAQEERLAAQGGLADHIRRSGKIGIYNDSLTLPESMADFDVGDGGYCSVAGLPLREDGELIGVFMLYAGQPGCFDSTVVQLLTEITDDMSFSMDHLLNEQRRLAAESKLHYLAFYDAQSGMPNRALLDERLPVLAAQAEASGKLLTLLDVRLQRLDKVVQILGSSAIDEVIRTAALRLESCRGDHGLVAQLSHDEFVVVSLDAANSDGIDALAGKVRRALEEPVRVASREVFLYAAIGAVAYPLHERAPGSLLRRARAAADRSDFESGFRLYTPELDRDLEQRVEMEAELHRALERGELMLHYQPQLDVQTGGMVGVEALMCWQHPQRGLISPGHFIALMEECGLMHSVGAWALQTACRQAGEWAREGAGKLRMAVNLSAQQFRRTDLAATVRDALERSGLDPKYLELELTESMILENVEQTIQAMHTLKQLGVSLSLDDFGTGYSSLSYLRRYPVDRIKIDQSFIRDMSEHAGSAALVRSILAMARNLGLETIAEGVETPAQFEFLRKQSCGEIQGFLFSRAVPPDEIARMLKQGRRLQVPQSSGHDVPEVSRMQSAFIANMSHELRTPLNAIIGFSDALKNGLLGQLESRQHEAVGDIFDSGKHLLALIDDILDLAKIEAGRMGLEVESTDMSGLLQASLAAFKDKAAAGNIRLRLEMEAIDNVLIDPRKTRRIVGNLLSNAVKFTQAGGAVTLRMCRMDAGRLDGMKILGHDVRAGLAGGEYLTIAVVDTGIGISAGDLSRLSQPFVQLDSGTSRRFEGSGLGLALVRQLVELHGGIMTVSSEPQQGSTFTVWLPYRQSAVPQAQVLA